MVKTLSDLKGVRVSSKAPRKMVSSPSASSTGRSSKKYQGSNPYHPREVPNWQKEITNFFLPKQSVNEFGEPSSTQTS